MHRGASSGTWRRFVPSLQIAIISHLFTIEFPTSVLPGQDKPVPSGPFREHHVLWFLVGVGRLRLGYLKFVSPSKPPEQPLEFQSAEGVSTTVGSVAINRVRSFFMTFLFKGGLTGLLLRAFNEGLPRPRVARARETNRLPSSTNPPPADR